MHVQLESVLGQEYERGRPTGMFAKGEDRPRPTRMSNSVGALIMTTTSTTSSHIHEPSEDRQEAHRRVSAEEYQAEATFSRCRWVGSQYKEQVRYTQKDKVDGI